MLVLIKSEMYKFDDQSGCMTNLYFLSDHVYVHG